MPHFFKEYLRLQEAHLMSWRWICVFLYRWITSITFVYCLVKLVFEQQLNLYPEHRWTEFCHNRIQYVTPLAIPKELDTCLYYICLISCHTLPGSSPISSLQYSLPYKKHHQPTLSWEILKEKAVVGSVSSLTLSWCLDTACHHNKMC